MKLFAAVMLSMLLGVAQAQTSPQEAELHAYMEALAVEVEAGRMSIEQAKYHLIQRSNQLQAQQQAQRQARDAINLNALGIAIQGLNQSRPTMGPSLNCNTFQRGQFGNITCY